MQLEEFPVHCVCGYIGHAEEMTCGPHWITCASRSDSINTISAKEAGCGCASTKVDIYRCYLFDEPVLKRAAKRCLPELRGTIDGFTGRTCQECESFTAKQQPQSPTNPEPPVAIADEIGDTTR